MEVNLGRITYVDYTKVARISENDEYDGLEAMRSASMAHTRLEHELKPQHAVNIFLSLAGTVHGRYHAQYLHVRM